MLTTKISPAVDLKTLSPSKNKMNISPNFVEVYNDLTKLGTSNAELNCRHKLARKHAFGILTLLKKKASKCTFVV